MVEKNPFSNEEFKYQAKQWLDLVAEYRDNHVTTNDSEEFLRVLEGKSPSEIAHNDNFDASHGADSQPQLELSSLLS